MKAKWLISSNCYTDGNQEKMVDAAKRLGCEVNHFKYIPFEADKKQKLQFPDDDVVVAYGSIELIKLIQRVRRWYPGAWVDWDALRCVNYLTHWGQFSVHYDYAYLPVAEILRNPKRIFERYGVDGHVFFRPDANMKGYAGQGFYAEVVHETNWDQFIVQGLNYPETINQSVLTMFSRPSKILREWRIVMGDRKAITGSQYRKIVGGTSSVEIEADCPLEARQFAEMIASGTYEPAPIYCMDVCETPDGFKLVEIGGMNCAGLYCCDIEQIVIKATEIAEREWQALQTVTA